MTNEIRLHCVGEGLIPAVPSPVEKRPRRESRSRPKVEGPSSRGSRRGALYRRPGQGL